MSYWRFHCIIATTSHSRFKNFVGNNENNNDNNCENGYSGCEYKVLSFLYSLYVIFVGELSHMHPVQRIGKQN